MESRSGVFSFHSKSRITVSMVIEAAWPHENRNFSFTFATKSCQVSWFLYFSSCCRSAQVNLDVQCTYMYVCGNVFKCMWWGNRLVVNWVRLPRQLHSISISIFYARFNPLFHFCSLLVLIFNLRLNFQKLNVSSWVVLHCFGFIAGLFSVNHDEVLNLHSNLHAFNVFRPKWR